VSTVRYNSSERGRQQKSLGETEQGWLKKKKRIPGATKLPQKGERRKSRHEEQRQKKVHQGEIELVIK